MTAKDKYNANTLLTLNFRELHLNYLTVKILLKEKLEIVFYLFTLPLFTCRRGYHFLTFNSSLKKIASLVFVKALPLLILFPGSTI